MHRLPLQKTALIAVAKLWLRTTGVGGALGILGWWLANMPLDLILAVMGIVWASTAVVSVPVLLLAGAQQQGAAAGGSSGSDQGRASRDEA